MTFYLVIYEDEDSVVEGKVLETDMPIAVALKVADIHNVLTIQEVGHDDGFALGGDAGFLRPVRRDPDSSDPLEIQGDPAGED